MNTGHSPQIRVAFAKSLILNEAMHGNSLSTEKSSSFSESHYKEERVKFTSKEWDDDAGLYYYNARWYDANSGRFTSEDPIRAGLNYYVYVGNNPVNFVDPTGLNAEYDLDEANKEVTIDVDIEIYGDDATPEIAELYKENIEDRWAIDESGNQWQTDVDGESYSVTFDVNVTIVDKPNVFEIIGNTLFGKKNLVEVDSGVSTSKVFYGAFGQWRSEGRSGRTLERDNPAAHEFGHLLGFKDRYHQEVGASGPLPGWDGNIMGSTRTGHAEQRNIDSLVDHIESKKRDSGVLRVYPMKY